MHTRSRASVVALGVDIDVRLFQCLAVGFPLHDEDHSFCNKSGTNSELIYADVHGRSLVTRFKQGHVLHWFI